MPFISRLSQGAHAGRLPGGRIITYSLILELILALNQDDARIVRDYLLKYEPEIADNVAYYEQLIEDALAYYREVLLPARTVGGGGPPAGRRGDGAPRRAGPTPRAGVAADPDALQTMVFQVAKDREIRTKDWFRALYRIFLGQSQGPRIGSFIALLGYATCIERLGAHLEPRSARMTDTAPADPHARQARKRSSTAPAEEGRLRRLLPFLGPAFIASIAYMDPGNFATNIQGGAQFGFMLLWVILASNLIAMLIQTLSAKLGIASGKNLAEHCREQFRKPVVFVMWILMEIVAMATDLAEFLGAAIGFYLLLGIPLLDRRPPHRGGDVPHPQPRTLRLPPPGAGHQRIRRDHRGELPRGDNPGPAAPRPGALPHRGAAAPGPGERTPGGRHPRGHGHAPRDFPALFPHAEPRRGAGAGEASAALALRDRRRVHRDGHRRAHQHGHAHHGRRDFLREGHDLDRDAGGGVQDPRAPPGEGGKLGVRGLAARLGALLLHAWAPWQAR